MYGQVCLQTVIRTERPLKHMLYDPFFKGFTPLCMPKPKPAKVTTQFLL